MKSEFEKVGDVFKRNGKVWKVLNLKETSKGIVASCKELKSK